ncbi:Sterol esterase-like protein [Hapsidospora chrysogenum ATCC 11550]|uniref:Sterol esterase-like protein n=1 Tax=Hapsidospora chrysogenum (strain ATCC 11550 / CBS 779.69 / DSM 880 / IAM 14645 / JCM 23072 / IMI 49137) TaxID=857340 RepID=A0A086T861_HAPC1|nr:Sterol esterase-like protein [Hapsidospora chrysogenum ATCC 11550]
MGDSLDGGTVSASPAATAAHGKQSDAGQHPDARISDTATAQNAADFSEQAEKLAHERPSTESHLSSAAIEAQFVTPHDPVLVTADGSRLPGVPLREAHRLNILREELQGRPESVEIKEGGETKEKISNVRVGADDVQGQQRKVIHLPPKQKGSAIQQATDNTLQQAMPPSHTNPLFPPLPLYGPSSVPRDLQCLLFRISSSILGLAFLGAIVIGSLITSIPTSSKRIFYRLTFRNLDTKRIFYEEEKRRAELRKEREQAWKRRSTVDAENAAEEFPPTEGGKDPIVCDVGYYARRVGLDVEEFEVQTEDGFIIDLWHVYDPKEYTRLSPEEREQRGPRVFQSSRDRLRNPAEKLKFPVLLIHGLLQSAGAYCSNDDESLAFWLCKSGYDVWLGNNRCGFRPRHVLLKYNDPRMWCWNIRQFGVFDLPALISRVLLETGFEKIGLICHSQGTTQTLVALAKEQRPDLGDKLTVFCALAPAAYAGPLIGKMYFKFMRIISPAFFRIMFGIHAFIPFMMSMHAMLEPHLYGWLGYKVFSFLFDWTDTRWDRGLRDRMFQFSPVYVSAESMRWWLGRECFARHKCILSTKETMREEERIDSDLPTSDEEEEGGEKWTSRRRSRHPPGASAWYNEQVPPFALWVCGKDDLVDGRKLLKRFESGREPHVRVCHSKVIEEYEHLDVIWAIDAEEQVFREVREVLWKTCHARDQCRVPKGCENVAAWKPESTGQGQLDDEEAESSSSSQSGR